MKNYLLIIVIITFVVGYILSKYILPSSFHPISSTKLQIVTSFYPLYFFTTQIVGDTANIYNITPAGTEPHDYEPTSQDISRIENSNLVILNGGNFEPWSNKIEKNIQNKKIYIIKTSDKLNTKDPHVWLSPPLAKQQVTTILAALIKINPQQQTLYKINAQQLNQKLDELDRAYRAQLASCNKKDFITSHAAFGHLAKTYNLQQVSISGLSPDEEPSAKQLVALTNFAKKNNMKYIFFESLVSPKLSETLAQEVGAHTLVLDPIEGLTTNEMKANKNYFTIMYDNLTNLKLALECK